MWDNLHIFLQTFHERFSLCSLDEFRHRMILNNLQAPIRPTRSQLETRAISIYYLIHGKPERVEITKK